MRKGRLTVRFTALAERHSLNTTLMNLLRALRSNKFFGSLAIACSPASSASSAVDSQKPSKKTAEDAEECTVLMHYYHYLLRMR